MKLPEFITKNWIFLIPVLIFTSGILYARSIEAFAGIGMVIMTLIFTIATLVGAIYYRITNKVLLSILITVGAFLIILGGIILSVRLGF